MQQSQVVILDCTDLRENANGDAYLSVTKAWQGAGKAWGASEEDVALPKTASFRDVMIPKSLMVEIDLWRDAAEISEGPLFLLDGKPPKNWGRALRVACQKAGIQEISPYGLRHANATMLMEAGVPLGVVADQLGNSIEVLVQHYLGFLQGSREMAPVKLESFWSEASA